MYILQFVYLWQLAALCSMANFGLLSRKQPLTRYSHTRYYFKDTINLLQLFIIFLPMLYVVLDYYHFEQVILSKFTPVTQVDSYINPYIICSIKETNWLRNKGMCIFLFDVFEHLLLRKTSITKHVGKVNFLERKLEEMHQL